LVPTVLPTAITLTLSAPSLPSMETPGEQRRRRSLSVTPPVDLNPYIKKYITHISNDTESIKQAFYNSAANTILISLVAAGIGLWFIFQSFIEPLFWALLCGALLHPIKTSWKASLDTGISFLIKRNIPLLFGLVIYFCYLPSKLVNIFRRVTRSFKTSTFNHSVS
jgi:hypothetical protein